MILSPYMINAEKSLDIPRCQEASGGWCKRGQPENLFACYAFLIYLFPLDLWGFHFWRFLWGFLEFPVGLFVISEEEFLWNLWGGVSWESVRRSCAILRSCDHRWQSDLHWTSACLLQTRDGSNPLALFCPNVRYIFRNGHFVQIKGSSIITLLHTIE